jgi:hypothetical protein
MALHLLLLPIDEGCYGEAIGWIGAKINFGWSQLRVRVDIFPVLDLRISIWVF